MKRQVARLGAIGVLAAAAMLGASPNAHASDCSVWKSGSNTWSAKCSSLPGVTPGPLWA
jgi:hypothetical protein